MTEIATFCRVCEAECGVVATVEDGRIVDVKADRENPHSQGFMCTKAKAMVEVTEDPDRVLTPLRRVGGPGEFAPVSWDEALDDIAARLKRIVDEHGPNAFATFSGNPAAFDVSGSFACSGFRDAVGSELNYGINGEDAASYNVAAALQWGSGAIFARPDIWRTGFLLMVGANPWISKGSVISEPQIRRAMKGVIERGGRVVVIDPRRSETARHFEHVAPRPGTDAWLLLGMLGVIFDEGLEDAQFIRAHTDGDGALRRLVARARLETCAEHTRVPAETIAELARGFATASSAAAYGRTGFCTQRFGTLNNLLLNALNVVTGNLGRAGGAMFGYGAVDFPKLAKSGGLDTYGAVRSRVTGLPATLGFLPSQALWRDIVEPGPGRIRALLVHSANPVLSSGAGPELAEALGHLDLHVSLDIYVNETNRHADYILPGTTFYERSDLPMLGLALEIRPTLYATEAVVPIRGDARDEWRVLNDLARRMGRGGAYPAAPLRWLAKLGVEIPPMAIYDLVIRTGPFGDLFGLRRSGWSLKKQRERHPHGVALADHLREQPLESVLATKDKRVHLTPPEFLDEAESLLAHAEDDAAFPLRMIGLRELHSHNSWMHNVPRMMPKGRVPSALIHPEDAAAAGMDDDGPLRIESAAGAITVHATLTDEMTPGTVAVPHGWGHDGGWRRANATPGVSSNRLTSSAPGDVEALAGMSILSGIPIRISGGVATGVGRG
jgi:anaerobic selenocysteine-containing dehydrogenase